MLPPRHFLILGNHVKRIREAGQVFLPPSYSPFGESNQPDGGRLVGRVLACLIKPQPPEKGFNYFQKFD